MKPLPLLLSLSTAALIGGLFLISNRPNAEKSPPSLADDLAPAPLPPSFAENEESFLPPPEVPLLTTRFEPDAGLVSFVENSLGASFESPPVFVPVSAEDLILIVTEGLNTAFSPEKWQELQNLSQRLGLLSHFQPLDQTLITILVGEVRGLVTPTRNFILHDFQSSSPPEQAALVNLLAQRLLTQRFPAPAPPASLDALLARHFAIQALALATELDFRKPLPPYPPSLAENIRESILLGLPNFFHELATFSEFHLLPQLASTERNNAYAALQENASAPSRILLAAPFAPSSPAQGSDLGALPLYLILHEATDPTTARTLATALVNDEAQLREDTLLWSLTFASEQTTPRVAEALRHYYSLRSQELHATLKQTDRTILLTVTPLSKN